MSSQIIRKKIIQSVMVMTCDSSTSRRLPSFIILALKGVSILLNRVHAKKNPIDIHRKKKSMYKRDSRENGWVLGTDIIKYKIDEAQTEKKFFKDHQDWLYKTFIQKKTKRLMTSLNRDHKATGILIFKSPVYGNTSLPHKQIITPLSQNVNRKQQTC
ncbi:CLUMA_CG014874, isoform A [Clunio marinus]|uniref:CLUMA_CG014874, isoform A n=1 Tax=Clunio marinus TaxID=568069 RepID=A0A1J1IN54_9DIPT|nr:CLUMA_CG014874, isoform A [Clunio marinus]